MEKKTSLESQERSELSSLDADFIRVLEDLIDALLANGVLRVTDLPPEAMAKLNRRKSVRNRMRNALNLLDESDDLL